MPFDGSGNVNRTNGVNSGTATWQNDRDAGTAILASRHDVHDQDLADAIENCVARDGQNTPSTNLPMGNFLHTGVGVATARTHYARASQVQDNSLAWAGTAGGTANALTASLSPAVTAYATGTRVALLPALNNTSAATLNLNAVGNSNIKKVNGQSAVVALQNGDILANKIAEFVYDGTQFILTNPSSVPVFNGSLAAAGTNQSNAAAIDSTVVVVTAADGTKGVLLPAYAQGSMVVVLNQAVSALLIYPPSGWSIASKSANASISIPTNSTAVCFVTAATQYGVCAGATL